MENTVLRSFIFACTAIASSISLAQTKFNSSKPLMLEYESKVWNKNPSAVDSSTLLLRDNVSKRIAIIELSETGENTNVFTGQYSVNWGDKEVVPEVYFVPKELTKTQEQMKKVENMIKEGTLLRKPFFFRMNEKMNQVLTVYDSKEQALAAFDEYRRLRTASKPQASSTAASSALDAQANMAMTAALEAQANAAKLLEMQKLEKAAQAQLAERQRLEAEEKQKQEELKRKQEQLAADEREQRKKLAEQAAELGINLYKVGQYAEAEKEFAKATELDPSNTSFYFQYGVTLYRTEKYNRSLVVLGLAQGKDVNAAERDFFLGSNYMKLKEDNNAIKSFESAKARNDKSISPAAAFYAGVIQFEKENYDPAKGNFEFVLDNSADPALDKQAESYIEQIANIMSFRKEQQKRFIFNLTGGLIYDSNILSLSNSSVDQPTDLAGFRWSYGGSAEYRPVYNMKHEFSALLSASDIYSTDQSFKAKANFQNTDPLLFSFYAPYKYKGMAFQKAYVMSVSPGYEMLTMNADGSGGRENILNSMVIKNDHTFIMNDNWFATYGLELRQDTSKIDTTSNPEDDLSATKISLNTTQTFFQNAKKTEAWVGGFGYSMNNAKGENNTYNRIDLSATYMAPWKYDTTWTAQLALFNSPYSKHKVGRTDNGQALTLSLRKPLSESMAGTLSGSYTNNASTLATSEFNKYMIMTTFSWTGYR